MKLIKIHKSTNKNKRYDAIFEINSKLKKISFGSSNHENYTMHKDKGRRTSYRQRHVHDKINDPTTPGALSWHILWGDSVNLTTNLKKFKRKFNI